MDCRSVRAILCGDGARIDYDEFRGVWAILCGGGARIDYNEFRWFGAILCAKGERQGRQGRAPAGPGRTWAGEGHCQSLGQGWATAGPRPGPGPGHPAHHDLETSTCSII